MGSGPVVSEEKSFENVDKQQEVTLVTLASRLSSLGLNFDITEQNSNRKKKQSFGFSHSKAYSTKFNLAIKYVKVNSGSSFI